MYVPSVFVVWLCRGESKPSIARASRRRMGAFPPLFCLSSSNQVVKGRRQKADERRGWKKKGPRQ